jgi:glycosyltransferase 2 family protein
VVLFDPPTPRRILSPTDVVRLLIGLVMVVGGGILAQLAQGTIEGIEADLLSAFARLPDQVESSVLRVAQFATGIVPLLSLVVLAVRRQWRVAALLLLAAVIATLGMIIADALVLDRQLSDLLDALGAGRGPAANPTYPDARAVASSTAVVVVAAPWLSRRWKRTLWGAVGVLVVLRMIAVSDPAFDLVLALGVGLVAGSVVLLLFGSPAHEPRPDELLAGLREAGFDPAVISRAGHEGTALLYEFTDRAGRAHDVLLRTPDERDADLLERLYRQVRFRASEVTLPFATLQRRIEHEVLVRSLAAAGGANIPPVLRIGTTARGSAFFVSPQPPSRPATADDLRSAGFLDRLWAQVAALHSAGIAHRNLSLESIRVAAGGEPMLTAFDRAQAAPSGSETARDVAQLLTETALVVGPDEAVAAAVETLGPTPVSNALRMLQPLALPATTRARAKEADGLLAALRHAVEEATGAPDLELEDLERLRPRTVLVIGASALAFYTLLPQLANLGDTASTFGDAQPVWLAGAVLASAATYVAATVSFQGAVPEPLPFAANLRAQVAASFTGLVGPAGAGGFALTARFLERTGVGAAEAGTAVAVRAVSGFLVHLTLMAGFFVWAGNADVGGFSLPDSNTLLLLLAILLALVGVLTLVRPVRHRVLAPAIGSVTKGASQLGQVFTSPVRVVELFGGAVATSLAYVVAVAFSVAAFGGDLGFAQIGAAYLGAVAIATLAPTPGGLGALESSMIAGLTGFGLSAPIAVSATLAFRLVTFWLPILPGWLALGWMQRAEEL